MRQTAMFSHSPIKASNILGTRVVAVDGEILGNIKEMVIDPATGRLAYVVMSFGGFLTLGVKLFAIPFRAFEFDFVNNQYVLRVAKARLKRAPGFDADHWPSMADEKWNRDVHAYYGETL
ncbi:MAG TPA: PRC-barrel domain-containing protein [Holophaga sp.]|nr:PRC-barrel domain-containing protein [Holophaga sp.]